MISWGELAEARRHGSLTAQRMRRRHHIALDRRVDIFAIIEQEGIWLMFQPLDGLFGFYRRVGEVAGIVINAKHPTSLQRYTAAHEYGHHVLGHGYSLDEGRNLDGASGLPEAEEAEEVVASRTQASLADPRQEAAAQAFAATFLMPTQVVNRALVERGLDRDHPSLTPIEVYELSLEFGTSYAATVTQLAVLEKISWSEARSLRHRPIEIKSSLVGGRRPADARADIWLVRENDGLRDLPLRVGDEVVIQLHENPSTGYAWTLLDPQLSALEIIDEAVRAEDDAGDLYGGGAVRDLQLRATRAGHQDVRLALRAPWDDDPIRTVVLRAEVGGSPTGDAPNGLVVWQQQQRVAVA